MAQHGSFISTPSSTTSCASGPAPIASGGFSIFQETAGQPLVFSPPSGTPELQALVDAFISLDLPISLKMEMIQRDFEVHTQRTGERYKTYTVSAAAITPPPVFTASPSPIFHNAYEPVMNVNGSGSGSGGSGHPFVENGSLPRTSPSGSDLTDPLFALPMTMFPASQFPSFTGGQPSELAYMPDPYPVAAMAGSGWPDTTVASTHTWAVANAAPQTGQHLRHREHLPDRHRQHQKRPERAAASMQIVTRDGQDITHLSTRATRTREERENTRIVRQRGACSACRRKKTRCDPSHEGFVSGSVSRATPYAVPPQSGRAKADSAAVQADRAAKDKAAGKKPVTSASPTILAPQDQIQALSLPSFTSDGMVDGLADWNMLQDTSDPLDWTQLSDPGLLLTDEVLGLDLTASMTSNSVLALTYGEAAASSAMAQDTALGVQPSRPQPLPLPSFTPAPTYSTPTVETNYFTGSLSSSISAANPTSSGFSTASHLSPAPSYVPSSLPSSRNSVSAAASSTELGNQPSFSVAGGQLSAPPSTSLHGLIGSSDSSGVEEVVNHSSAGLDQGSERSERRTTAVPNNTSIGDDEAHFDVPVPPGPEGDEGSGQDGHAIGRGDLGARLVPGQLRSRHRRIRHHIQEGRASGTGAPGSGASGCFSSCTGSSSSASGSTSAVLTSALTTGTHMQATDQHSPLRAVSFNQSTQSSIDENASAAASSLASSHGVAHAETQSDRRANGCGAGLEEDDGCVGENTRMTTRTTHPVATDTPAVLKVSSAAETTGASHSPVAADAGAEIAGAVEAVDVVVLFTGLATLVYSMLPSLLEWASAARDADDSVLEVARGMERMVMGSSLVTCQ